MATNFLKENIRELDNKLQEQQTTHISVNIKRGTSLLYEPENDEDDDNLSWTSAPTWNNIILFDVLQKNTIDNMIFVSVI